jgi:hypothetical protein
MRLWPIVLDPIQCVFVHNHDLFPFVYFFSFCFFFFKKKKKNTNVYQESDLVNQPH